MSNPEMIVGHSMTGPDNGRHYYKDAPANTFCQECGSVVKEWRPATLTIPNKYDFSYTYENKAIVSARFRQFLEDTIELPGRFHDIGDKNLHYNYVPERVLTFDAARRGTRFSPQCTLCGNFRDVTGAKPAYLKTASEPLQGLFRSDLGFGSGREKNPIIIVGSREKILIQSQGFKGPYFEPAFACSRSSEH